MDPNLVTYFAETDARNKKVKFGIKAKDRLKHVYVIGKTGMGKSTLLENMAVQDIQNGNGMAVIDPHGSMAEKLLDYIPESRLHDVIYFAPFDTDNPISFNLLEDIGENKRHLVVNGLMATFEKIWADAWSARMAYILSNTLYALLETPGSTLLGVNRMYSDKAYRNMVVNNIKNVSVKNFWTDEYAKYSEKFATEATAAIQNKVGQFTSNALVRNIIGQSKSTFDIRKIMDEGKLLIVNLSKGQVGDGNANLLGSMLITKIYLAALSRADLSEAEINKVPNFYLYVDEFQSFANKSFANILSEARKYKLNLTIAHQYIEQMEEEVRDAVFGNVGTMITFRVGAFDAEVLEKEFAPTFTAEDLVNLGFAQIYLKLMINGVSSQPFSATTLGPITKPTLSMKDRVIEASRKNYAHVKAEVEAEVAKFHDPVGPSMSQPASQGQGQNGGGSRNDHRSEQRVDQRNDHRNDVRPQTGGQQYAQAPRIPVQSQSSQFSQPSQSSKPVTPHVSLQAPLGPERDLPPASVNNNAANNNEHRTAFTMAAEELKNRTRDNGENMSRTVSLSDLKPEHEKTKIPTKENVGSLKDALSAVLAQQKSTSPVVQAVPTPTSAPTPKNNEKVEVKEVSKNETKPIQTTFQRHEPVREVPEDVLRKLLSMDEPLLSEK